MPSAVQGQGPLVAGERLEVAAEVMAGEADRHPRGGVTAVVAGFLEHGQGLPMMWQPDGAEQLNEIANNPRGATPLNPSLDINPGNRYFVK